MPSVAPRIVEEDSPHLAEMKDLLQEYDLLLEKCMTRVLTRDEHRLLNELYEVLFLEEYFYWDGVSDEMIANILGWTDTDFLMLRYYLGMLPSKD